MIPRIETGEIIEIVKKLENNIEQVIEVGAGAGAITISIAKELEYSPLLYCLEYYEDAIKLLKKNIKENKLEDRISIIKSNLLSNTKDIDISLKTVIVANLPYISQEEYKYLQPSVKDYEPKSALVGGSKGYEMIIGLIDQIVDKEFNIEMIILEGSESINQYIKEYSNELFPNYKVSIIKDMYDRDRFIQIQLT